MINRILFRFNLKLDKVFPRPSVGFAQVYFKGKEINCCEVGTYVGINAKNMLEEFNIRKLFLIDPYKNYNSHVGQVERAEDIAKDRLYGSKEKVKFIKEMSSKAHKLIPDCDFIYIDANHTYDYVKEDIGNFWKKIKKRGILAGHDFDSKSPGVIEAVTEFCHKNKLKLNVMGSDWWIIKTETFI